MSLMGAIMRPFASSSSRELEKMIRSVYGGNLSATGISVDADSAMRVGAVYACVLVLSQSVAQLPIHLFKRTAIGKEHATDHNLYPLILDQPNEWMTDYDFKQLVMVHLLLRGNSVWFKTQLQGEQRIRELIPIHPDRIKEIQQDEQYRLFYKVQRPNSADFDTIPGNRVVHFRGLSTNGFTGVSPIEQAREMIGLSLAAEKHGAKMFTNGARLGGILQHPGKISQQAAKRLEESFNAAYAGVENAHKTALIEEGMTWEKITMTAEDAQFLETRKYQRSEIAGFYRVPSHLINDLEKATFSNVEHLDLSFVKHTLGPWNYSIEKTLKKDLLTPQEKKKHFFKINTDALLRGDIKVRSDAYSQAVNGGWLSPNEIRELEDRNPYKGGDTFRTPLNTGPAGGDGNEPEKTPAN